jgi:HAMP domain-containing protein
MRVVAFMALVGLLAACSPAEIATDVTRRAARTVVLPVITATTPAPANELATDCVMANATNAELNDLARDVGNRAGTLTEQNIRMILAKPSTQACIAGKGLAPVTV